MPYSKPSDLPDSVKGNLPAGAQHVYLAAYNAAMEEHGDDPERCAAIAWAAVKRAGYAKNAEDEWVKESAELSPEQSADLLARLTAVDKETVPMRVRRMAEAMGKAAGEWVKELRVAEASAEVADATAAPITTPTTANPISAFVATTDPEVIYQQITEAIDFELGEPKEKTGAVWDVRVLKFGRSHNGFSWSREAGEQLLPLLESAPVGCFMDKAGTMGHASEESVKVGDGPLVRNVVADLQTPRLEADGVYASLHVHEDAGWLKQKLLGLASRGVVDKVLGLSVDTLAGYVPVQLREGAAKAITAIKRLLSVDIVTRPSADGRFIRATAGPLLAGEDQLMTREQLIALIQSQRPKLLEGRVVESLTDVELTALVTEALREPVEPPKPDTAELDKKTATLTALEQRLAIRESQERVAEAVAATELPEPVKAKIKRAFAGKVAEQPAIEAAVKEEIETWAKLAESGKVQGVGVTKAEVTLMPRDKIQAGLDMLFGVTREALSERFKTSPFSSATTARILEAQRGAADAARDNPGLKFRGLQDYYVHMTGDTDVSGYVPASRRVSEAATVVLSTDWAQALGDTLYRRLLSTYAEVQFNERSISRFSANRDFRVKHIVHLGYFADLVAVAENGAYDGIVNPTDDEVQYAVTKRGGLFSLTLEAIKNDDIRAVTETVDRLGRAARRTLARFVWSFWGAAATGGHVGATFDVDSVAWFDSTSGAGVTNGGGLHCNYGVTALTADATGAALVLSIIGALAAMTEKDSGEKLGVPQDSVLWLDVPIGLYSKARLLNQSPGFTLIGDNPCYRMFGENNERINVNALFVDTSDWGVHIDPNTGGRESVEVGFLDGREEPEMFLQDMPTQGALFTNDRISWKIRHIYGGDLVDIKGAHKNIVA